MTTLPKSVIFWGAGATAALGMRITAQQGLFMRRLAGLDGSAVLTDPLERRVALALDSSEADPLIAALSDMLTILGDQDNLSLRKLSVTQNQIDAMRRNRRREATDAEIQGQVISLRSLFDWNALKAVIEICPAAKSERFNITDLFNVLDLHGDSGHGFPVTGGQFLAPQQVFGGNRGKTPGAAPFRRAGRGSE